MAVGMTVLASCTVTTTDQESIDAVIMENESLNQKNSSLSAEIDKLNEQIEKEGASAEAELASLQDQLDAAQKENQELEEKYSSYKERMSEYEALEAAEAEARQIEAERVKAEEAEKQASIAEEERLAAEQASREAEEKAKLGYETGITYEQLARTPDAYVGELVKFKGEVLQVVDGEDETDIRLSVHWSDYGYYDAEQVLYCGYDPSILDVRLLENDIITIYGQSIGLFSYQAVTGAKISLPGIWIDKIEISN